MPSSFEVCVNIGQLGSIALGADFKQCSLPFNIVASILEEEIMILAQLVFIIQQQAHQKEHLKMEII